MSATIPRMRARRCAALISLVVLGAVSAKSQAPDAARDLMRFLASPRALAVIKAQGMEPD